MVTDSSTNGHVATSVLTNIVLECLFLVEVTVKPPVKDSAGKEKPETMTAALAAFVTATQMRDQARDNELKDLRNCFKRYKTERTILNPSNIGLHMFLLLSAVIKWVCWVELHCGVNGH